MRGKVTMSASCKGEVIRQGAQWFCVDCGHTSSAWSTQHAPLQSKAANFLSSLLELITEVQQGETVGAAPAAP